MIKFYWASKKKAPTSPPPLEKYFLLKYFPRPDSYREGQCAFFLHVKLKGTMLGSCFFKLKIFILNGTEQGAIPTKNTNATLRFLMNVLAPSFSSSIVHQHS